MDLRRRLKALDCRFITAVEDEAARTGSSGAGCVACSRKPFPAKVLIGAIDKATGCSVVGLATLVILIAD